MKISDYFRRREERKPIVLKDLTKFQLFRVDAWTTNASDEKIDAATLYVLAESWDDVNIQIRRLVRWTNASWTTAPVRVEIDAENGTVADVASAQRDPPTIVNELIKELEKYPWNAEVVVNAYDGYEDAHFLRRGIAVSPIGLGDALLQTEEQDE